MNLNGNDEDYIVKLLTKYGIPVTKENYIKFAYPDGMPDDYELLASLPVFNNRKDTIKQLLK
jgi:hypothetical protein